MSVVIWASGADVVARTTPIHRAASAPALLHAIHTDPTADARLARPAMYRNTPTCRMRL